jgi:anti-sigma factor RsiW
MNPDKLFDYLEGRLPPKERAALEEQLIRDEQLQRELAVAQQIHAGISGDSREVFLLEQAGATEQRRKVALRVGAAFIILMALNVGAGLWIIAHKESKNPKRPLLEKQMREQIAKSLEHAAAALSPPPNALGISEITVPAATGKMQDVASEVATIAARLGGSAIKGLPDQHRISVLVDLPATREQEFRAAIASIMEASPQAKAKHILEPATFAKPPGDEPAPAKAEKKSFIVQITDQSAKSD